MTELLAPAGNMQALKAAIYAGADAVYLGFGKFNARQKAQGFDESNLKSAVELCHLFNVKVYITFNTVIKNCEIEDFKKDVQVCVDAKVDAFIVTDLGMLSILRNYDIPLHASTQMGIHNLEGAKLAKDLGFSRVVLARETLFEDIKKIATLGIEIEYFVHGALCVSFSGGCLLSSCMSGDSGNRGLCKQPCRHAYLSSVTNKEEYYLSPSDQCFIDKLKELKELNITSFKIEGRLKSAQYVGEVVSQYRKALNGIKDENYKEQLKRAYNRGDFTLGYNFDKTPNLMSIKVQNNSGQFIGKIKKIANRTIFLTKEGKLNINDGVKVFNNGLEIGGFRIDNLEIENDLYKIKTKYSYPVGASIHVTMDESLREKYENVELKQDIEIEYKIVEDEKLYLSAKLLFKDIKVELLSGIVLFAQKRSLEKLDTENKLAQINDTIFKVVSIKGELGQNAFYPISKLKEARRLLIEKLREKILNTYESNIERFVHTNKTIKLDNNVEIQGPIIELDNLKIVDEKFKNYVLKINERTFVNDSFIIKNELNCNNIENIFLKLPKICRGNEIVTIKKIIENNMGYISGICAENMYAVQLAREYGLNVILSFGLNIFNDYIHKVFDAKNVCSSLELAQDEYVKNSFKYAYGEIPVMTLTHCPVQLNYNCNCSNCKYIKPFVYKLSDKEYIVSRNKTGHCYFELLNNKKINLINKFKNLDKIYVNLCGFEKIDFEKIAKFSTDFDTSGHYSLKIK